MSSGWAIVASLLLGIVMGAGNVFLLGRTASALDPNSPRTVAGRIVGSYLLRTALIGLVLFLALRVGPEYAVVTVLGVLLGRGVMIVGLLRR